MICTKCGANLSDDAKFCEECGSKLEILAKKKKSKIPMIIVIASTCIVLLIGIVAAICIGVSNSGSKTVSEAEKKAFIQKEAYDNGYILYSSTEAINDAYTHTLIKVGDQSTYKLGCTKEFIGDIQLLNNGQSVMYRIYSDGKLLLEDMNTHNLTLIDVEVEDYYINSANDAVFYYTYDNELVMYDFFTCQIVANNVNQFIYEEDKILFVSDKYVYIMQADTNCKKQIINLAYDEDVQNIEVAYYSEDFSDIYAVSEDNNGNLYVYTNKGYSAKLSTGKRLCDAAVTENGKIYVVCCDDEYSSFDLHCFNGKEWTNLISNAGEISLMYIEFGGYDMVLAPVEDNIVVFNNGKKYMIDAHNDEADYPVFSIDGSSLYYIHYKEEASELYKIDVASNTKALLSDTIVPLDDMQELMCLGDNGLLYLDNCKLLDDYIGVGDLYYDKVKIDTDVCSVDAIIEENTIYYIKNYDVYTDVYDLYMYRNGKSQKIFENVSDFNVNDDGILFIECADGGYTDVYMIVNNKKVLIINDMTDDYDYSTSVVMEDKK